MRRRQATSFKKSVSGALLLAAGALFAAGCGGAAGEAKSGDAVPLNDQAGALLELNQAESQINAMFGVSSGAAAPSAPAASATPYAAPPASDAPAPQTSPAQRKGDEQLSTDGAAGDSCGVACRALASMSRAAEHFCGLAGEDDVRCSVARERVKTATDRVAAHCTCKS